MSFKDLGNKDAAPHVDSPAQAEARAQAVADVKAKADAKVARAAAKPADKPATPRGANPPTDAPSKR